MNARNIFYCLLAVGMSFGCSNVYEETDHGVIVKVKPKNETDAHLVRMEVMGDKLFHVSATKENKFADSKSLIIVPQTKKIPFTVKQQGDTVIVSTGKINASVLSSTGEVWFTNKKGEIILQGCRRQILSSDLQYVLLCLRNVRKPSGLAYAGPGHTAPDREPEMIDQLLYEPALLPGMQTFRPRIIDHPHIFGPRYHPVEIICPHSILIFICRKPEPASEFRGDERRTDRLTWERTFIGGQNDYIGEIQRPGLQRPHDLKPFERLSLERHGLRAGDLLEQSDIRGGQH